MLRRQVQRTLIFVEKPTSHVSKVRSTVTFNERHFGAPHLTIGYSVVSTNIRGALHLCVTSVYQ
jgi:hypothetical protein